MTLDGWMDASLLIRQWCALIQPVNKALVNHRTRVQSRSYICVQKPHVRTRCTFLARSGITKQDFRYVTICFPLIRFILFPSIAVRESAIRDYSGIEIAPRVVKAESRVYAMHRMRVNREAIRPFHLRDEDFFQFARQDPQLRLGSVLDEKSM